MAAPEPLAKDRLAPPCWWREGYTFALAAVVAVHLVLGPALITLVEWADSFATGDMMLGFLLGQLYLLGLWAALGGLGTIARWAIVGTLSVAGSASCATVLTLGQDEYLKNVLFAGLLAMLFVTGVAMCLLPLRGLAGWRVDFDPAFYGICHSDAGRWD